VERLYPISVFGKYGFVDATGRVVVTPTYDFARAPREGLAAVKASGGGGRAWGYVDASGAFAIAPRFDEAESFVNGRAVVAVGKKKGIVDAAGAWVVEPAWERVEPDGELWRVQEGERTGWLGPNGEPLVPPRWDDVSGTRETMILVRDGGGASILDPTTGSLLPLTADETRWPGKDSIPARQGKLWGWLDARGEWILPPAWGYVDPFVGDRAVVRKAVGRFGLVARDGREILPAKHVTIRRVDGGWMVEGPRGSFSHVDDDGRVLSGPWKATCATAIAGLVLVEGEKGWGAVDPRGEPRIDPIHEELTEAGDGLLAVCRGGRWGYLDPRRPVPMLVEPRFASPGSFDGELLAIDDGRAYVDRAGREVWRRPPPRAPVLVPHPERSTSFEGVKARLAALAKDPPAAFGSDGAAGHGFVLGPALSEPALAALEREHGVTLPAELRAFLREVGDGPAEGRTGSGGAGPGYGLYAIESALEQSKRAHQPFVPARTRAAWAAASGNDDDDDDDDTDAVAPGLVVLGTNGCAFDYALAVTGPYAGTMWTFVDPGWLPDTLDWPEIFDAHHGDHAAAHDWCWKHLDELTLATFATRYLIWLERVGR